MESNTLNELIINHEKENDYRTIHIYYVSRIGLYVAFGFSAFLVDHITQGLLSFSDDLQMPVIILSYPAVQALRRSTIKKIHNPKEYYCFELRNKIGPAGYEKWVENLKK